MNNEQRDERMISETAAALENGTYFARHARSERSADSMGRGRPPVNREQWSRCIQRLGAMAAVSDPLAQMARELIQAPGLYFTAPQVVASIHEAAHEQILRGYDDVLLRTGPEAPRPSACHRRYSLHECIQIAYWICAATDTMVDSVPTVGWCVEALAQRHRVSPPLCYRTGRAIGRAPVAPEEALL